MSIETLIKAAAYLERKDLGELRTIFSGIRIHIFAKLSNRLFCFSLFMAYYYINIRVYTQYCCYHA